MDTIADAGMQSADGGERRRRTWSADQKQRIIAESFAPGASVAEVARRYGLNSKMLFTLRRRERADVNDVGKTVNIVPVRVVEATPTATATAPASMGRMEIVLVGGERIIVGADVDATHWPGWSRRSRGDDSDPEWSARVARDGPYGMGKGSHGLALIVQETLRRDPHSGHLFVFRGRRGSLIKCLWSDGQGLCLFSNYLTSYCTSFRWKRAS
jgi:transposase-like protein